MSFLITATEHAWAAGFFDGEGCSTLINVRSGKCPEKTPYLLVTISQTNESTLKRFQRAVGNLGKINGPYTRKNPYSHGKREWSSCWKYDVHGKTESQALMNVIWPFLGQIKKDQFTQCMATIDEHEKLYPKRSWVRKAPKGVSLGCAA